MGSWVRASRTVFAVLHACVDVLVTKHEIEHVLYGRSDANCTEKTEFAGPSSNV